MQSVYHIHQIGVWTPAVEIFQSPRPIPCKVSISVLMIAISSYKLEKNCNSWRMILPWHFCAGSQEYGKHSTCHFYSARVWWLPLLMHYLIASWIKTNLRNPNSRISIFFPGTYLQAMEAENVLGAPFLVLTCSIIISCYTFLGYDEDCRSWHI